MSTLLLSAVRFQKLPPPPKKANKTNRQIPPYHMVIYIQFIEPETKAWSLLTILHQPLTFKFSIN